MRVGQEGMRRDFGKLGDLRKETLKKTLRHRVYTSSSVVSRGANRACARGNTSSSVDTSYSLSHSTEIEGESESAGGRENIHSH